MTQGTPGRKILIIEDEPAIRNVLFVLLAGLDCESEIAHTGQQALSMISRRSFDAILLDLRSTDIPPREMVAQIKELRPNLVGRVLVVTGEVTDPKTLEWIESQCLESVTRSRLMQDLWDRLKVMLGLAPSPNDAGIN